MFRTYCVQSYEIIWIIRSFFVTLQQNNAKREMPRKTDGIEFEIHPRPTKGEDGKPLLYVRPAKGRKKSFKQLEDFCNKYRNLRTGELQMVMDVMMDVVGIWLSDGYRVETPIGSFAPKLKLLGEHTDPKTIHGRDIEYAGIEFIPSKEFIKEGGKNREGYRKSGAQVGNSQMYDEKAMDEALRRCMKLGYATIPEFMIFSGLKRDSAKAYLDSLCKGDHPRLWKVRESRRWLYFPKKDITTE